MAVVKTKHLTASVPASLVDQLAELAKAGDRSVSAEVRRALKAHVEAQKDNA